jgi:2-methylcitrate dehydratase PrpD
VTTLQILGQLVTDGVRGRISDTTRKRIGAHITDTVGAWVAGAHAPEGKRLLATAEASIDNNLRLAVAVHCALARLSEVDDIHLASSITPGGIVIPAALTIAAAREKLGGETLLEAIVAGIEVMVRLGLAIDGPAILYRGIWPTYFTAACGVAAVAARLYDLDSMQFAHALALALTFAAPGVGHHNAASTSRWFALGHAASNGLIVAQAAKAGFTSDLSLLDNDFLDRIYGITPNVNAIVTATGSHLAIDETSIKPWCGARQTIAATYGLLQIIDDGISGDAITEVRVGVPPPYLRMINHGVEAGNRASYLTSVQFRLALAACDRARLYQVDYAPPQVVDDVKAFMQKISVAADPELLMHYPKAWPAKVVVRAASDVTQRFVVAVPGDPQQPFDEQDIESKFRRVLTSTAVDNIDELLTCLRSVCDPSPLAVMQQIGRARALVQC